MIFLAELVLAIVIALVAVWIYEHWPGRGDF